MTKPPRRAKTPPIAARTARIVIPVGRTPVPPVAADAGGAQLVGAAGAGAGQPELGAGGGGAAGSVDGGGVGSGGVWSVI